MSQSVRWTSQTHEGNDLEMRQGAANQFGDARDGNVPVQSP